VRKRLCPYPGIDIAFEVTENGLTDLLVNVRYKNLPGNHKLVQAVRDAGRHFLRSAGGSIVSVAAKDEFRYNGTMYAVKELLGNSRVKCCDGYDSDVTAVELSIEEVTEWVREHNSKSRKRKKTS